ncbi:hypothetical protein V6R21_10230 [Limibacter armeniacum]|uniref:hypothetical protein n=1 Tax=Limibacter armeniacum TaxID=466084 RepID=UPI002FE5740A
MRIILFYLGQALLGLAFYELAYMATLRLDFFEWGNSQNDGLYLLFVPMVLLPIILVASIVKYFVTKKMNVENIYKWSFLVTIGSIVISTFLAVIDALWLTLVISLLTILTIIIETIILSRQLLTKGLKVKT